MPRNNRFLHVISTLPTGASVVNVSADDAHPPNTATIAGLTSNPSNATASQRSTLRINAGAAIQNNTSTLTPSADNPEHALAIGSYDDGSLPLTGYIAELLIISGAVSTLNRQKIEGYLAHKWGLTANLPAGHPYKTVGPTP